MAVPQGDEKFAEVGKLCQDIETATNGMVDKEVVLIKLADMSGILNETNPHLFGTAIGNMLQEKTAKMQENQGINNTVAKIQAYFGMGNSAVSKTNELDENDVFCFLDSLRSVTEQ